MNKMLLLMGMVFLTALPLWAQEEKPKEGGASSDPWTPPKVKQEEETPTPSKPQVVHLEGAYPVAELRRPLSLPAMTLEPHLNMVIDFYTPEHMDNFVTVAVGTSMGIIEYLEAGLDFLMALAPEVEAGMDIYGLYEAPRMFDGKLFLAGRLRMMIPFSDGFAPFFGFSKFNILFEAPTKYLLTEKFGLVGCAGLGGSVGRGRHDDAFVLHFAGGGLFQPIDPLALSVKMELYSFLSEDSHSILPLIMEAQYTLFSDLDIKVSFGFMDLTEGADWIQLLIAAAYRVSL